MKKNTYQVEIEKLTFDGESVVKTGEKEIIKRTSSREYKYYWRTRKIARWYRQVCDEWIAVELTTQISDSGFSAKKAEGRVGSITEKKGYLRKLEGDNNFYKRTEEIVFVENIALA